MHAKTGAHANAAGGGAADGECQCCQGAGREQHGVGAARHGGPRERDARDDYRDAEYYASDDDRGAEYYVSSANGSACDDDASSRGDDSGTRGDDCCTRGDDSGTRGDDCCTRGDNCEPSADDSSPHGGYYTSADAKRHPSSSNDNSASGCRSKCDGQQRCGGNSDPRACDTSADPGADASAREPSAANRAAQDDGSNTEYYAKSDTIVNTVSDPSTCVREPSASDRPGDHSDAYICTYTCTSGYEYSSDNGDNGTTGGHHSTTGGHHSPTDRSSDTSSRVATTTDSASERGYQDPNYNCSDHHGSSKDNTPEPTPSREKTAKEESSMAPSPSVTSAFSPATSNDDNAKVTTPDLSTLEPIVDNGAAGSSSKKKNGDSSSNTILNDTKSGSTGGSSIGGVNLVLLVVGIIGGVVASLFFVRTRQRNGALRAKRGSSQQRALDAFFEQNASTRGAAASGADRANSSMLQRQTANGNPSSAYSNGSSGIIRDPLTPANEIALASFISRSTGSKGAAGASAAIAASNAASSSAGQRGRFDDSVLRGTAAFQMTGPLPPSPSGNRDSDLESARSSNSRIGISFVSDASSEFSLNPSESSNGNGYGGFYQSEVHGSEIGDFRSTGGMPSMISSETSSMHRSDSNFSGYTKSSFASTTAGDFQRQTDDYRLSSGVYSVGPLSITRTSSASSLTAGASQRNLMRTNSHESIGSSEEEYDESAFNSLIISKEDGGVHGEDDLWRTSELSEGEI